MFYRDVIQANPPDSSQCFTTNAMLDLSATVRLGQACSLDNTGHNALYINSIHSRESQNDTWRDEIDEVFVLANNCVLQKGDL